MPSRRQWLSEAYETLEHAGASDARLDAQWLLSHVTGIPRLLLLADLDAPVDAVQTGRLSPLLTRRASGEPLQYVLGEAVFMDRVFAVDSRVLIPRQDTEVLCRAAVERIRAGERVLDIGTGSGALAVSMQLACPACAVTAVDISAEALCVARENASRLGARVEFVQGDLFAPLRGRMFAHIVSNPPYIPAGDLPGLQKEVRAEPRLALDGGGDGLFFFRRIMQGLAGHLLPGGSLLLEVGDGQAQDVSALMRGKFRIIQTLHDLAGLARVVTGDGYAG